MPFRILSVYTLLWILPFTESKNPDAHVTCIYNEDCILPCSFPPTEGEVVIRWYQQEVLKFTNQKDDDGDDDDDDDDDDDGDDDDSDENSEDSGMSLFTDEIPHGNASLLLEDSSKASRGRYKCVVNTTNAVQESFVIVKVEAPISRISIESSPTEHVQCSSHGVYPAPVLQWSTEPNSPAVSLKASTRISEDSKGLYSIESTLKKLNNSLHLTYICTITSKYSSQAWKAYLLQTGKSAKDGQELVIPCVAPKNLKNFTLTWTFTTRKKSKDIFTYHSQTHKTTKLWENDVEMDQEKVLKGDGSLYLGNPVEKLSGTYTCTFSGAQITYIVQTNINFNDSRAAAQTGHSKSKLWVLAVVVGVMALIGISFYFYKRHKDKSKHSGKYLQNDTEMQARGTGNTVEELPTETNPLSEQIKGDS